MFVTKTVVDGTTNEKHPDQTPILKTKAIALGLEEGKFRRRTPQEILYDTLVVYKHTDGRIRLLENTFDWTEQKMSDGHVVRVGHFDADGAFVSLGRPDGINGLNGACLSR